MVDLAHIVQVKEEPSSSRDWFSNAFTCNHCELGYYFDDNDPGFWSRCKPCARKMRTWQKCKKWKKIILDKNKHKTLKFITLTIKNPVTFGKEGSAHFKPLIMKPWNKLKRRLLRRGTIEGGLYAYEYTYDEQDWQGSIEGDSISTFDNFSGDGGMFLATVSNHPHLHIIAIGDYIPQDELLSEWRDCVGHDKAGVHIFAIKNPKHALGYVTKYISKSSEAGRNREPFGILRGGN